MRPAGGGHRTTPPLLGKRLEKLAKVVGVTTHQIQKYERGSDGLRASRLLAISSALDVPVSFFFENTPPAGCEGPVSRFRAGGDADTATRHWRWCTPTMPFLIGRCAMRYVRFSN